MTETIFENLEAPTQFVPVNSAVWWGQSFGAPNCTLTPVVLNMGLTEDLPGEFFVRIYNHAADNTPGASVGADLVWNGSPSPEGKYEFILSPGETINLDADIYYVVAGVRSGTGSFVWNYEQDPVVIPEGSSTIGFSNGDLSDPDNPVWSAPDPGLAFNMQVNAEPVPEPANMALGIFGVFLIGAQSFRWWNARRRQIDPLASR